MEKNPNIKKKSYLIISVLCLLSIVFYSLFFIWQGIYLPRTLGSQEEVVFSIQKGDKGKEIAFNLEKEGLIKWSFLFRLYTTLTGDSKKLQAGEYLLSPSMTIPEIAQKIVSGETLQIKITIPEGFTIKQIENELSLKLQRPVLCQFLAKEFKNEFDFLKDVPDEANLEGFLFPDTYYFSIGVRDKEICKKFLKNFDQKLKPELKEEISWQGKTIFEIMTMASMIEKEVKTLEDKKLVSGILWERLEQGMSLQVDATISYITGKRTVKILLEDLQIDSPYNTYKYKGLPLGPISNPGLDSIVAAIYPEESEFWYYLSMPEGETIFSKTLTEHNIAKAKYLK